MNYWSGLKPGLFVLGLICIIFTMNSYTEYFKPSYQNYKDLKDEHNKHQLVSSIKVLIALTLITALLFMGVFI